MAGVRAAMPKCSERLAGAVMLEVRSVRTGEHSRNEDAGAFSAQLLQS